MRCNLPAPARRLADRRIHIIVCESRRGYSVVYSLSALARGARRRGRRHRRKSSLMATMLSQVMASSDKDAITTCVRTSIAPGIGVFFAAAQLRASTNLAQSARVPGCRNGQTIVLSASAHDIEDLCALDRHADPRTLYRAVQDLRPWPLVERQVAGLAAERQIRFC